LDFLLAFALSFLYSSARAGGGPSSPGSCLYPPRDEATSPGALEMDWILNNFWIYMGILIVILIGLVAVLFVVRKNQE
jgi:hypothetical protein